MSDQDRSKLGRIQTVLTALLQHQMNESLEQLADGLAAWRDGDLGPFEAHGLVIEHVTRAKQMAARVAQIRPNGAAELLRDAFDAELLTRDEFQDLVGLAPEAVEPASASDPPDEPELPDKRGLVEQLLEGGPVLIHLDGRAPDLSIPATFRDDPRLVLRFGYELKPPISDLRIDASGIAGTLTFGGAPHFCEIPWNAVYAVVSEVDRQGMVWPGDVPTAVLEQLHMEGAGDDSGPIPARQADPEAGGARDRAADKPKRRPSYLKLVE